MRVVEPCSDARQVEKTILFEVEAIVPFELDDTILVAHPVAGPGLVEGARRLAERESFKARIDGRALGLLDPRTVMLDAEAAGALSSDGVQAIIDGHRARSSR
jgi:hypothetical protein